MRKIIEKLSLSKKIYLSPTPSKLWSYQALLTHTFRKHDHNHNRDHQPFFVLCRQQVFQAGNNKGVQQTNLQRLVRREVLQRSNQLPPVIGLTTTTTTTTTNKPHSHRLLPTTSTVLPASSSFSSSSPSLSMFVYVYLQYIYIHIQGESLEFFALIIYTQTALCLLVSYNVIQGRTNHAVLADTKTHAM